jgi:hypothetical protein
MNVKCVFDSIAAKLRIDFEFLTKQIEHRQSKGRIRELEIVEEFLRVYMPGTIGIGHGEIVATSGEVSNETDIVFYHSLGCPILLNKDGYKVFPVECVHGIMEVKSDLDARELEDAFNKISRLKRFPKTAYYTQTAPGILTYSTLYGKRWSFFPTIGVIFAYDSISLKTLCEKLTNLQSLNTLHERIDFVIVLEKGLIINWNRESNNLHATPTPETVLRPFESSNPLLLAVVFLQQLLQTTFMPQFKIQEYIDKNEYGRFIDELT